ncbi:MAG: hypothetical protein LHW45_08085 [Candidatus Cloacimonetes bacterium]|nr:hypothetical protein [Candidatus Cloacimonadota bacterium]MDY0367568.1 hypothetical protein [Candidatus Syntrophosphaera sp.]
MDDLLIKILFALFGLYSAAMTWIFKSVYGEHKRLQKEHGDLREKVASIRNQMMLDWQETMNKQFDHYLEQIDAKLDAWWNKIECNLMNEGRLPPRRNKKNPEQ